MDLPHLRPARPPPGQACASLIIDRGRFWIRSTNGALGLLPERNGRGYGVGYGGGGPGALAEYIQQLVDFDGKDTSVTTTRPELHPAPGIEAFVESKEATRTQELTLAQLKSLAA